MKYWVISFLLFLLCFSVNGQSIELALQLGEKQQPTFDRLLPDVARFMAFNKDSTRLIAKGMGGTIVAWDLGSRQKQTVGNINAKRLFAYAADTHKLLIQKVDDVIVRNLVNSDETHVTSGEYESGSLSADGTLAVLSKGNNGFDLWKLTKVSQQPMRTFKTSLPVRNVLTLSNDGQFIAAAEGTYRDGEGHRTLIEIWDTRDEKQPLRVINTGEILGVWNLIFSHDAKLLAADTQRNAQSGIRVWDVKTGAQLLNTSGFEAYWTRALAFAPNPKTDVTEYLASGDEKGYLRIWKIPGGTSTIRVNYPTGIQTLAFSPNGSYLAVALWDTTIQILEWSRH